MSPRTTLTEARPPLYAKQESAQDSTRDGGLAVLCCNYNPLPTVRPVSRSNNDSKNPYSCAGGSVSKPVGTILKVH